VRISGLRLDGGQTDPTESAGQTNDADAIAVVSSINVEIDHLELYRWRGTAVNIQDPTGGRLTVANADTVWVHDNYVHDNQHPTVDVTDPFDNHGAGYGVQVSTGGYALIEKNVFQFNRHAIASNGRAGSGYLAYRNLFLEPGIGTITPVATFFTHQIDVHGTNSCGIIHSYNCGLAGEYMDLAYNTVTGTDSPAVHLRGTPSFGMNSENNVFAQNSGDAIQINETGYHDNGGNKFSSTAFKDRKQCDFDGDGQLDPFMATGATWWYAASARGGNWVYLNQSATLVAGVTLADVNQDGRCDVTTNGQQFINPGNVEEQPLARNGLPVPDVRYLSLANATSAIASAGYAVSSRTYLDYTCSIRPDTVMVQDQFGIAPAVRGGPKPKVYIEYVIWSLPCQS
jgi:hypothetical protein